MFACDSCDSKFEMRIKLNRHIAKTHTTASVLDFLKPGAALTDDQKEKYFDELRQHFIELNIKTSDAKQRLESLEKQAMERTKLFPKAKPKLKKDEDDDTKHIISAFDHISLPAGWILRQGRLVAPGGAAFQSLYSAMKHLVREGGSLEDQARMRGELEADGWREVDYLPEGWMTKTHHGKTKDGKNSWTKQFYLSPSFDYLKGREAAVVELKVRGATKEQVVAALGGRWHTHPILLLLSPLPISSSSPPLPILPLLLLSYSSGGRHTPVCPRAGSSVPPTSPPATITTGT